jgi:hypothetical protein
MENGNKTAFPKRADGAPQTGLTKREYFAGLAMQAMVSKENYDIDYDFIRTARKSIKLADALLKELEKKENNENN